MRAPPTTNPAADRSREIPTRPSDPLLEMIIGLLAPLFLAGGAGDLAAARLAAIETLAAYQARTQADLLKIAQVIGFGLTALDCLRLSVAPDLPLAMALRLRGCANALNRSAQQNTRAMAQQRAASTPAKHHQAAPADPDLAASAEAAGAAADALAHAPIGNGRGPSQPSAVAEQRRNRMWADAMIDVAAELDDRYADVAHLRRTSDRSLERAYRPNVVDTNRPATSPNLNGFPHGAPAGGTAAAR